MYGFGSVKHYFVYNFEMHHHHVLYYWWQSFHGLCGFRSARCEFL